MTRFSEKGVSLERCSDRKMMDRKPNTLKRYAREFGLSLPDYVPMKLRAVVTLHKRGDFLEAYGDDATIVAAKLGLVVTRVSRTDDTPLCAIPAHTADVSIGFLKDAWIRVKKVKAKKRNA